MFYIGKKKGILKQRPTTPTQTIEMHTSKHNIIKRHNSFYPHILVLPWSNQRLVGILYADIAFSSYEFGYSQMNRLEDIESDPHIPSLPTVAK